MKSVKWSISIRTKLLLYLLITFFIFSLIILYLVFDLSKSKKRDLLNKIENTSEQMAIAISSAVYNIDNKGVNIITDSFLKDQDIVEIKLIDDTGYVFLDRSRKTEGKKIIKEKPIVYSGKRIANITIVYSDYLLIKTINRISIQFFLVECFMMITLSIILFIITRQISSPIEKLRTVVQKITSGEMNLTANEKNNIREVDQLAMSFNLMTAELKKKTSITEEQNFFMEEIIAQSKLSVMNLNSVSKEIEAAAQEQTSASNEHASGITEVSATIEELSITAKQIAKNVGELVFSSEEVIKFLKDSEDQLLITVKQLEDVGFISSKNAQGINDLGKRSAIINEMVEIIKEVANKTNILSINASIEASRSGEGGSGFSVVAAEIRELSKETITSAKNAEKAAKEIRDFLNSIILSTENEALKVNECAKIVNKINKNIEEIITRINNNYSFTQKIDLSIKQQEAGTKQAADTMKQLAEISRESAETARQTLGAVKDIVKLSLDLDKLVSSKKV